VFLSERDRYSIDVFLADGATGRVRRRVLTTAGNPRVESVQFIDSAGAWSADGARFALAALGPGAPVLTILGMPAGDVEQERSFDELDQIFDPTWSPDGRQVAFSGLRGGTTDLYSLDLESGTLRRLTADAFSDRQPAWSPDGASIAFVSDRFTSSIDSVTFGRYRLARLDLDSGDVAEFPSVVGAKNIDPQWGSADSLYFVADADGVSNVFRLDVQSGTVHQVTDLRNGVSGITALSPALSVAAGAKRLAYSVFTGGRYEIHTRPLTDGSAHAGAVSRPVSPAAAVSSDLDGTAHAFTTTRYRGGLSLDGIGQPYLSAGGGALGGFFRAGVSISFSDLLEQRQAQTAVQVGARARDFAVQSTYIDRRSRWTWGVVGAQLPASFSSSRTYADGDPAVIARDVEAVRQTHRQGMALAAYPFSRSRRIELTGGLHAVAFDREIRTRRYARADGALIEESTASAPAARGIVLAEAAAAAVYDTSVAGPTAPVLGRRSRFEVAPTFGDLSFVTVTADYRRYDMPVRPITVALRVQHVGRYGADAGDPRLLPLVWTIRDLVRGYSLREAAGRPCTTAACDPLTDFGTRRLFVGNIELRAPVLGPLGLLKKGLVPVDAFLFADLGRFESASGSGTTRTNLRTIGAGARVNAAGFVFEVAAAHPYDRAGAGWTVAANIRPGF
jgi:hypothetical protein